MKLSPPIVSSLLAAFSLPTMSAADWEADKTLHSLLLPTEPPTSTIDESYECVLANLTQYFDPPKPTGALSSSLDSYADGLFSACTITGLDAVFGCWPAKDAWCQFPATLTEEAVQTAYSSWASAGSVWFSERRSTMIELAQECPSYWFNAMYSVGGGPMALNETIVFGACYEQALGDHTTAAGSQSTASTPATPAGGAAQGAAATPTGMENSVLGRGEDVNMWVVAGGTLAAAAAVASF